ncbi:MAG TPA: NrfD/PsrC family molybdoenzyme membrane anchor subunit [Acidiferrobacterales bacterium]|nr:NrfD/PsrC family molybdoenzyme membrane anchor subunit [Acidiferrobacterales bacterium]
MKASLATFLGEGGTVTTDGILKASAVALAVTLATTLFILYAYGHAAFNTSNYGITWGLPISTYVFLVLTSTGLTFVASLAMIFGFEEFYPVAKRCVWLAVAALVAGFTSLGLEIGHPFRMLWALPTGMQVVSPMFWMGVFYTLYFVFLLLKFQRIHAGDWHSPTSRLLGIVSVVSVVVAHGTLGLVFGMMVMRPMWYSDLMPIYFLITAALSGAAFAVFFTYLAYGFDRARMPAGVRTLAAGTTLPKIFATLIGATIIMVVSRTATGLWTNLDGMQVVHESLRSPWFHFELWAGLVLPFALMLSPWHQREPRWQVLAAVLVIVSLFIARYDYMIGGQRVPAFKGGWIPGLIDYTPSFGEWMIALTAFSLVFAIYAVGEKLFNLAGTPGKKG